MSLSNRVRVNDVFEALGNGSLGDEMTLSSIDWPELENK